MAGEVVGFSGAAVVGVCAARLIEPLAGTAQLAGMVLAVLLVGSVEGSCVGLAQWLVLREPLPAIRRRMWLLATVSGAVVAWGVGMALGTSMGDAAAGAGPPSGWLLFGGAAAIGAIAGVMLGAPQWLVLRRAVQRAGWWVAVHAIAWATGMLVAFLGMALIDENTPVSLVAAVGAATGLAMGALVASMTGLALVWLVKPRQANVTLRGTGRDAQSDHGVVSADDMIVVH